jgi:hypothetical protein
MQLPAALRIKYEMIRLVYPQERGSTRHPLLHCTPWVQLTGGRRNEGDVITKSAGKSSVSLVCAIWCKHGGKYTVARSKYKVELRNDARPLKPALLAILAAI